MKIEDLPIFNPEEHLARLKAGSLLFSEKILMDPNFQSTLVLICHHSDEGAYGLVLNRPSHMPLSEIFNSIDPALNWVKKVFIGGPVQIENLQILQITKEPALDSLEIAEDVYLGGHWEDLNQIISEEPQFLRLFLGYSGWGKGQLEDEIKSGSWEVYNCELKTIFSQEEDPWIKLGLDEFKLSLATTH